MRALFFCCAIFTTACGGDAGSTFDLGLGDRAGTNSAASDAGPGASRCTITPQHAECSSHTTSLTALIVPRAVTYEVPLGAPPATGWPTVIFFQGTTVAGKKAFAADADATYGQYQLTRTVKALLDAGYAVVAPDALLGGATAWETNIPPFSFAWTTSSDHLLMLELFRAIGAGELGTLDAGRLYAMGISSGGFMTSRMAVSYAGKFRALAVHSGSYATCSNTCKLPATLPADHPPTLFLHGEVDNVMPISILLPYRDKLIGMGILVSSDIDPNAGHEWLESGATSVPAWFAKY